MSLQPAPPRGAFLVPFRVRSFRFQWPADLLTSWAQEMETLILGWYILTATGSVFMLTLFASLQFLGTLLAPVIGSIADILGRRAVLCGLRACYALLAGILMVTALSGAVTPGIVLAVSFLMGLIRPSDLAMRHAMIGDTMGPDTLGPAVGLSRLTLDSARIAGALAGAGLFATVGLGPAYIGVVSFYALGFLLTLGTSQVKAYDGDRPFSIMREVRDGLAFSWRTPRIKALMLLAFLINLCAFPVTAGLLPFAAREVFGLDETGLGRMIAMFGLGAMLGSLLVAFNGGPRQRERGIVGFILMWFLMLLAFGQAWAPWQAYLLLGLVGLAQGMSTLLMAIVLLDAAGPAMRSRIMGVRTLAIYGLPIGLVVGGRLVEAVGYRGTVTLYCAIGLLATLAIAAVWRDVLAGGE